VTPGSKTCLLARAHLVIAVNGIIGMGWLTPRMGVLFLAVFLSLYVRSVVGLDASLAARCASDCT